MNVCLMSVAWAPEFLRAGGVVMILLLICSVFALAVCLERAWSLRRGKVMPAETLRRVDGVHTRADADDLAAWLASTPRSALGDVVAPVLENLGNPREQAEEAMIMAGRSASSSLERGLGWIEIVAATAPLLGLLGTVLGMLDVFSVISVEGVGATQSFSAGIKKALYTTVAGLAIGIPALAFFIHYSRRIERLAMALEQVASGMLSRLYPSGDRGLDADAEEDRP